MKIRDTFLHLAHYYDPIMKEVNYDRWLVTASYLADLLPRRDFAHIDIGCGTGVFTKKLIQHGWNSIGVDLSYAMLKTARSTGIEPVVAAADMRALPFTNRFDYATCIFDSLNFMLSARDLNRAVRQVADVLHHDGLFYFDLITERMVLEHFAGKRWTEDNGRFSSTWEGSYDDKARIAETMIRIHSGPTTRVRERVHTSDEIKSALKSAGFHLLGLVDAETWRRPSKKTVRLDVIATKSNSRTLRKEFRQKHRHIADTLL